MKKMYFMLTIIAAIAAPAAKGQANLVKPETVPDSVWALNDCYSKIEKLDQFQKEKRKLEPGVKSGDVLLAVHVIPRSFFKDDSGKNIIAGFINEEWKTGWKVAYIVRFDSAHHILSVTKPHRMTHEETALALSAPKTPNE